MRDEPQGHTMLDACSMLMEPQGHTNRCLMLIARNLLGVLLMGAQRPMLDAVMIILFIRLWTGSTLERFTSGLWQKSYDLHWHLMNDISAYVLYQITQNANLNELILLRYCGSGAEVRG